MCEVNIKPTKLYKMRSDLQHEERVIVLAAGIKENEILWLDSNRASSLGGYIGNFRRTYLHRGSYYASVDSFPNMPMRYFQPVY